jgi:nicotinate-nucleotide pyrophosphorylase (carboxylating)
MSEMLDPALIPQKEAIHHIIRSGLKEDIGRGDLTSTIFIDPHAQATCTMVTRQPLTLAGISIAAETFALHDASLSVELLAQDGTSYEAYTPLLKVQGNAQSILAAERTALNLLSYLSGIATYTQQCVGQLAGTGVTLLDSRKTLPLYRMLAKYAVRCGGGRNHRLCLDDGVMIKDNHIAIAGGISAALKAARARVPALTKIEIECDTLDQVREAIDAGADVIMLDNMTPDQIRTAVALVGGRVPLEVSGGVRLETLRDYAETGVQFISMGALTHSVRAVDIGLDWREPL